jgi:formate C-acetyltransferase
LLADIRRCPRFGNDQDSVDLLAKEVADIVFGEISRHACWRGGRFLPGCLLFATYAWAGSQLTSSPDGRRAGEAIADSIGPHQGRDLRGPTAMLKSVAKLDHAAALGTLVLNLRLAKSFFDSSADRRAIIDLVQGYFNLGGMQLQISVIDQEVMRDAVAHPERHGDLIVRIGGYSEYFNNLSPELKQTVLERTEHAGR